jgi:hypothetical protein
MDSCITVARSLVGGVGGRFDVGGADPHGWLRDRVPLA